MASNPRHQPITVEQFLAMDFGTDRRFELEDGVIHMMTGGSELHAWVQNNLAAWLRTRLRGSPCRSYGSEMGIRITDYDVRYPGISIHCGSRPEQAEDVRALATPIALIEVLSPSTSRYDQTIKLEEYESLESVRDIAFVDPVNELVRVHSREGKGWHVTGFSAADLHLPSLDLTMPHAEIFARD